MISAKERYLNDLSADLSGRIRDALQIPTYLPIELSQVISNKIRSTVKYFVQDEEDRIKEYYAMKDSMF